MDFCPNGILRSAITTSNLVMQSHSRYVETRDGELKELTIEPMAKVNVKPHTPLSTMIAPLACCRAIRLVETTPMWG